MSEQDQHLLERCRAGDQEAARTLFENYVDRLLPLARRRISQRLASRIDPEDVVQSVFRTFFHRLKAGQFQFQEQDDLSKLLVRITVHKALRQTAYHKAAKRNPGSETEQGAHTQERILQLLDREPTPEVEVEFLDQLEHFLSGLQPQERQIIEMRLQGCSNEEILQQLGIKHDRTIRRVIERIRALAEQEGFLPG